MTVTVSRGSAASTGLRHPHRARTAGRPRSRTEPLFDEARFDWPVVEIDEKKEAKLPYFTFLDRYEARAFMIVFILANSIGVIGVVNFFFIQNDALGWFSFGVTVAAHLLYLRHWIRLCKRVQPVLARKVWFSGGLHNPTSWQAMSQARAIVRQR